MNDALRVKRTSAEPIYAALREQIISGALAPGEKLLQDEIARTHGVSKIPVREALLRLETDGFVLFEKNRGAFVRELSSAEILDLMDIRVALECKALELAIPNMIQSDLDGAAAILEEYSQRMDVAEWSAQNLRFHHALYEPCANPSLMQLISDIQQRIGPNLRHFVSEISGLARPDAEHRQILQACRDGDSAAAVALLARHIETTKKETAARLRRRQDEGQARRP
jgi:DNA-binding GntR family transcriptional regulator